MWITCSEYACLDHASAEVREHPLSVIASSYGFAEGRLQISRPAPVACLLHGIAVCMQVLRNQQLL